MADVVYDLWAANQVKSRFVTEKGLEICMNFAVRLCASSVDRLFSI